MLITNEQSIIAVGQDKNIFLCDWIKHLEYFGIDILRWYLDEIVIYMLYDDDDIGGLIMPIIINTQEMMRKNQIRLIASFLSLSRTTSTLNKLGDADELSD